MPTDTTPVFQVLGVETDPVTVEQDGFLEFLLRQIVQERDLAKRQTKVEEIVEESKLLQHLGQAVQISFTLGWDLPARLWQTPLFHELIHDVFADFR